VVADSDVVIAGGRDETAVVDNDSDVDGIDVGEERRLVVAGVEGERD